MLFATTLNRSNRSIFIPRDTGSPHDSLMDHISSLGPIARLDFERCAIAGEVIYTVEGDSTPVSQQDEEARIATLAYALKKLGNRADAAEFMRCLNAICEEGDARYWQVAASYYYNEIAGRGTGPVLKEMALIAMQLASLNPVTEEVEDGSQEVYALCGESKPRSLFDREVAEVERMIRGRRKSMCFAHNEWTEWLNDLEANGASLKELDDAFTHVEALDQYDEGGAIIHMSAHERTVACGRLDHEFTPDDLPEQARHLAVYLRRAYTDGVKIDEIWDDINAQLDALFPIKGRTAQGGRFFSRANLELQGLTRNALEAILEDCYCDCHLSAMRYSRPYRRFYQTIREADDTKIIGQAMKEACAARESGELSLKYFTLLKTASRLQRERLERAPLSKEARVLIREVEAADNLLDSFVEKFEIIANHPQAGRARPELARNLRSFPDGQPAESPVRLALATILQFIEGFSDRAAADAVRSRIERHWYIFD
jgi:plasmid stabilization system protein ParE